MYIYICLFWFGFNQTLYCIAENATSFSDDSSKKSFFF